MFTEDFEDGFTPRVWSDCTSGLEDGNPEYGIQYTEISAVYANSGTNSLEFRVGAGSILKTLEVQVGPDEAELSFYHIQDFSSGVGTDQWFALFDNATSFNQGDAVEVWADTNTTFTQYTYTLTEGTHELIWRLRGDALSYSYIDDVEITGDASVIEPAGEIEIKSGIHPMEYNGDPFDVLSTMPSTTVLSNGGDIRFSIENTYKKLVITDIRLENNSGEYSIAYDPTNPDGTTPDGECEIDYNDNKEFVINFSASAGGPYTTDVIVESNDDYDGTDESTYTFELSISATGTTELYEDFDTSDGDFTGLSSGVTWDLDESSNGYGELPHLQNTYVIDNYGVQFGQVQTSGGVDSTPMTHGGWGRITTNASYDLTPNGGTLIFNYRLDSEYYDAFEFETNRNSGSWNDTFGGFELNESGDTDWRQVTVALPQGSYQFRWEYDKDDSISLPMDCAWIDNVVIVKNP